MRGPEALRGDVNTRREGTQKLLVMNSFALPLYVVCESEFE